MILKYWFKRLDVVIGKIFRMIIDAIFCLQLQHLGELGRVEETHELMIKLEQLEKARDSERLALSNSAPKVRCTAAHRKNAPFYNNNNNVGFGWI